MMRNFIAKIGYIDMLDGSVEYGYAILQANNYSEAAEKIEDSYRDDLINFTINELEEGTIIDITKKTYASIMGDEEV